MLDIKDSKGNNNEKQKDEKIIYVDKHTGLALRKDMMDDRRDKFNYSLQYIIFLLILLQLITTFVGFYQDELKKSYTWGISDLKIVMFLISILFIIMFFLIYRKLHKYNKTTIKDLEDIDSGLFGDSKE